MRKQLLHPRTEAINKKQQQQTKLSRQTALAWLRTTFPQAFDSETRISPLKVGIMHDILQHADIAATAGISKSKLREAVVIFTRRMDYLACLKAREMRIDLYGVAVAEVTVEEAEIAALKIKKRIDKTFGSNRTITRAIKDADNKESMPPKTIIIKHKSTKTYDPAAVSRLREKLGLRGN